MIVVTSDTQLKHVVSYSRSVEGENTDSFGTISIGNHTHLSPIWEIIVLAIFKIVRGEAEYDF